MVVIILLTLFNLFFSNLLTNYLPYLISNLSFFSFSLSLTSLVLLYPFFNNDNKKYLIYAGILGLVIDILVSNTLFLNVGVFILMGAIVVFANQFFINNPMNDSFLAMGILLIYNILIFLILNIIDYNNFSFLELYNVVVSNVLITFIYTFVMFHILRWLSKKYRIKKIY